MDLFSEDERRVAEAVAGIAFGNPFLPERIALEKQALGLKFVAAGDVIVVRDGASYDEVFPNVRELHRLAKALTADARQRLRSGHGVPEHDRSLYEDLV